MRKTAAGIFAAVMLMAMAVPAMATNGTNIIGVGTLSRSMGGVGVAAPQDAITAVFGNPAAMCYIPCKTSEVDFDATIFDPTIKASAKTPSGTFNANSNGAVYAFPAIGIYTPISDNLRFGLAAYGVSGMGVNYKETDLKNAFAFIGSTAGEIKTDLQVMKFSPNLAYRVLPNLSVGAAVQINWAQLDLGSGSEHSFGLGTQVGVIYKPIETLSLGLTYQSAQKHSFKRVYDLNGDGMRDNLALEQPQQVALGVAYEVIPKMVLVEVDGKWYNWSDAAGYKEFGWRDQWIAAVGMQVKPVEWASVRLGYNYGTNPVKDHIGWNPFGTTTVQSSIVPNPSYEYFRTVGFPAVVEQHITAGLGIDVTPKLSINMGYTHAFGKSAKSASLFNVFVYESKLVENSYEVGLNIKF